MIKEIIIPEPPAFMLNKKRGRPMSYNPETLEAKFEEYAKWAKKNPRYSHRPLANGKIVRVPLERPLTLSGFAVFAKIIPETFREYEKRPEFSVVCARVRARIETDQLEGALCEQFNPSIASRVLKLADRQDITTNGKEIKPAAASIPAVVLDAEAAKVIQSIGKK